VNNHLKLLELVKTLEKRPKLLLHSCCGPCSSTCLEFLNQYFDVTVLYYNPNIEPLEEYLKRKKEQIRFITEYDSINEIKFLDCDYENEIFRSRVKGLEEEKEGGARCPVCFHLRLEYTADKAHKLNFDYFGTTLTVSPHKNSNTINKIGAVLEKEYGIKYLYSDFKKKDGYKRSIELSKEYNLYRQDYCGCIFSKEEREQQKKIKLEN